MKSRWRKLRQRAALALAPELAADRKAADVAAVADRLAKQMLDALEDRLPPRITIAIPEHSQSQDEFAAALVKTVGDALREISEEHAQRQQRGTQLQEQYERERDRLVSDALENLSQLLAVRGAGQ